MQSGAGNRRGIYAGVMLGALILAGCTTDAMRSTAPSAASSFNETPSASVAAGEPYARELASLRQSTARYHSVGQAIKAGYADPEGIGCVASPAGTMGVHVPNQGLIDLTVVPDKPEVLLYLPKANGGFKLVAVEYLVPVLVRNTTTNVVTPWFSPTQWGAGYVVVNPAPSVFGQTFAGPMGPHEPGMPWHYDQHVWIWESNPAGMFAQFNPSISCT